MKTQQIREVVCQQLGVSISLETFTTIGDFLMLWSLFESKHFINPRNPAKTNCNERSIASWVKTQNQINNNIDAAYSYFKARYTNTTDGNVKYDSLGVNNGYKTRVLQILTEDACAQGKFLAVFIILYQLRNNLFHGVKDVAEWNLNKTSFDISNNVILSYVSLNSETDKSVDRHSPPS